MVQIIRHQFVFPIHGIHVPTELELFGVAEAADLVRLGLGFAEGGQKHAGQNGDDGDHHQKFDQGKGAAPNRYGLRGARGGAVCIHRLIAKFRP